jgi:ribosome-associated protein
MIPVTDSIRLPDSELRFDFIRADGPGGQNVNKVATAVQLRFDAANSPSLPQAVRHRLLRLAGSRATKEGVVIIDARRFRSQAQNRRDAVQRLAELIRRAAARPLRRRPTRPTKAAMAKRLERKRRRSEAKRRRRPVSLPID